MTQAHPIIARLSSAPERELYFFALYRVLEAGLLAALVFSPLASLTGEIQQPVLASTVVLIYLLAALLLLAFGRNVRWLLPIVLVGTTLDIAAATLATYLIPAAGDGIAMLLLFNIAAAAAMLPLRYGLALAILAVVSMFAGQLASQIWGATTTQSLAELVMFSASYLAVALLAFQIGSRARKSQQLADQRGAEVANLFEINELIIRRMRTGVLVVDGDNHIKLANEAASLLLGDSNESENDGHGILLSQAAPELMRRLQHWRNGWQSDDTPMQLSPDHAEILPRFVRLLAGSDLTIIFLDDTTVVSRRAESLTLAALGRFSASLAHEIRNPLAAINYAVQLLEESNSINVADRRLLQIIHQQCQRTNGIVESVLSLARRERASPEHVELNAYVQRFVEDYQQTLSIETDTLEAITGSRPVAALVDQRHLHQVLTVLVQNALNYGRLPGEPARIRLRVFESDSRPMIDVIDRGPGIPEAVAAQLFRPFFTTSEHGTGLGLYIARELTRANQATLEYVAIPGGGCCFRIRLPGPHALQPT